MEQGLWKGRIHYEHLAPPFVLVGLLNRFDNLYQATADTMFQELSWQQMFFLQGVSLHRQPPAIQEMAEFLGCSHQNATKLCGKLLQGGYLSSRQDPEDRRKQRLYLSEKGAAFLRENQCGSADSVHEIFGVLTEAEIASAVTMMVRLTNHLEALKAQGFGKGRNMP